MACRPFADQPIGVYVDIGAYGPFNASNTLLLYRRGWSGINVEPDLAALARLRRFRARDINLGFAVSDRATTATFVLSGSFSGLASPEYRWADISGKRINVQTRRLDSLLAQYRPSGEIDLLDIDAEGHDLRSNDWDRFRPRLILAECHPHVSEFLCGIGYRIVQQFELTYAFERQD